MADIATIGAALSSLKSAIDIAKFMRDSGTSLEKAVANLKLAELMHALADTKIEMSEIQDILLEKDRRIRDLEDELTLQSQMEYDAPFYFRVLEDKKDGPFCQQCFDSQRKAIRLQNYGNDCWPCMTCGKKFYGKNYKPPHRRRSTHNAYMQD